MKSSVFLKSNGILKASIRWEIENGKAVRGSGENQTIIEYNDQKDLERKLLSSLHKDQNKNDWEIKYSSFSAGEYYPRIHRPVYGDNNSNYSIRIKDSHPNLPTNEINMSEYIIQLSTIFSELKKIFRYIAPTPENMDVYGHEIRNLLIISCTEVESQWQGILAANNYTSHNRYNTSDYIKIIKATRLNDFSLIMPLYPAIGIISPYEKWSAGSPTQSLDWYNAYNQIKHDRESNFQESKIIYAINAIAACFILYIAQYGRENPMYKEVENLFKLKIYPTWDDTQGYTKTGFHTSSWKSINFDFNQ